MKEKIELKSKLIQNLEDFFLQHNDEAFRKAFPDIYTGSATFCHIADQVISTLEAIQEAQVWAVENGHLR